MTINIADAINVNDRNEVFLQHRDENAPTKPNTWGLWGGHVEEEEDRNPLVACQRELFEELGVDIPIEDLQHYKTYYSKEKTIDVFTCRHIVGTDYQILEGDGAGWFKQGAIERLVICPFAKKVLQDFFVQQKTAP